VLICGIRGKAEKAIHLKATNYTNLHEAEGMILFVLIRVIRGKNGQKKSKPFGPAFNLLELYLLIS